jgi:hypothetical protein
MEIVALVGPPLFEVIEMVTWSMLVIVVVV